MKAHLTMTDEDFIVAAVEEKRVRGKCSAYSQWLVVDDLLISYLYNSADTMLWPMFTRSVSSHLLLLGS